jgi:putative inorganic carbon (hco3(-)) transporter
VVGCRWSPALSEVEGVVGGRWSRSRFTHHVSRYAPHLLFLVAGVVGVLLAVPEGRDEALREFRWLIAEPLLFYALVKAYAWPRTENQVLTGGGEGERGRGGEGERMEDGPRRSAGGGGAHASRITHHVSRFTFHVPGVAIAFISGGAAVGLLGLLQYAGLDIVEPLLGAKRDFSENIVEASGLRRVTSVYGHPNNLGLYLGRVWPLAAALALALAKNREPRTENREPRTENREPRTENREPRTENREPRAWSVLFVLCALLCLVGIVVSFSRAAWLGVVAAGAVLLIRTLTARGEGERGRGGEDGGWRMEDGGRAAPSSILHPPSSVVAAVVGVGAALVVLGGLALTLRGGIGGGSDQARLLLWREALAYIRQHPLGLGLDQFYQYHNPEFGRSLIDPALLNSSEVYAAHPHNLLLDTWLRVGPLGLLAFGWLLARFVRSALARDAGPLRQGALAALAAALVHGLVDNFYFVPDLAFAFWLLLALAEGPDTT